MCSFERPLPGLWWIFCQILPSPDGTLTVPRKVQKLTETGNWYLAIRLLIRWELYPEMDKHSRWKEEKLPVSGKMYRMVEYMYYLVDISADNSCLRQRCWAEAESCGEELSAPDAD